MELAVVLGSELSCSISKMASGQLLCPVGGPRPLHLPRACAILHAHRSPPLLNLSAEACGVTSHHCHHTCASSDHSSRAVSLVSGSRHRQLPLSSLLKFLTSLSLWAQFTLQILSGSCEPASLPVFLTRLYSCV